MLDWFGARTWLCGKLEVSLLFVSVFLSSLREFESTPSELKFGSLMSCE